MFDLYEERIIIEILKYESHKIVRKITYNLFCVSWEEFGFISKVPISNTQDWHWMNKGQSKPT